MNNVKTNNVYLVATRSITIDNFLTKIADRLVDDPRVANVFVVCSDVGNLRYNRAKVLQIPFPVNLIQFFNPFVYLNVVTAIIRTVNSNDSIVYVHTPVAAHFVRLARFVKKYFVIYHVHGFRFTSNCRSVTCLFMRLIEGFLSRSTNKYILINDEDFRYAKRYSKPHYLVPGVGVDCSKVACRIHTSASVTTIKVLVVAAYKFNKGYSDIIDLVNSYSGKAHLQINCYGYGDSAWILNEIKTNLRTVSVNFLGYISDIHDKYAEHDIFILPSRREGLPVSIQEAMCAGCLVIATDVRGSSDLIVHRNNGLLYHPGDINAIHKYIDEYTTSPHQFASLTKNAKKDVVRFYSKNLMAKKIVDIVCMP